MNNNSQRKPENVCHYVFLASFYLLVAVNASVGIDVVGGFDASGVDDAKARTLVLAHRNLDRPNKDGQYFLKSSVVFPLTKVVIDQIPWSKVPREHTPLASNLYDVENSIKYLSEGIFAFSFDKVYVRNNHLPLHISDVGWVGCHNLKDLELLYKVTT